MSNKRDKIPINGKISSIPLAINTMGSTKRMAMALGANSVDEVAEKLGSLVQAKPPTGLRDAMGLLSRALELRHARPKKLEAVHAKMLFTILAHPPLKLIPGQRPQMSINHKTYRKILHHF